MKPSTLPADSRSGRVVFVAHCLLNQNTRYPGGAVRAGVVYDAIRPYVERGDGLVQMPCPEQRVWGGVLKRRLLWLIAHPHVARAAPLLMPAVTWYMRRRYARLASLIGSDVADYVHSGMAVTGIVGVAGSPSCGVETTLQLPCAVRAIGTRGRAPLTAEWMNDVVVKPALCAGRGMFIDELTRSLARRDVHVMVVEQALERPNRDLGPTDCGDSPLVAPLSRRNGERACRYVRGEL